MQKYNLMARHQIDSDPKRCAGKQMKQCPECNRYYPHYTSACKCGYQFPVSEKAESESEAPDGSVILSLCSAIIVVGILTSIGSAIYLVVVQGNK